MSKFTRLAADAASLVVLPVLVGLTGLRALEHRDHPSLAPAMDSAAVAAIARPALDPAKPTVVVLLGTDLTEITDALGPYEMFARAGKYNVVTAAVERQKTLLTGGLQILPHYSLEEVDEQVIGAPAVVVIPNLPTAPDPMNRPVIDWITRQAKAGALIHSWCKGAMALAETGLLDGQTATAHWGDIPRLEKRYPKVTWVRGVRWIDRGQFVMSAGITSGIDASFRVLIRLAGDSVARRVAQEMRYPNFHYAVNPEVDQYALEASDAILLGNAAFRFRRPSIGLALYDGVGELDLSNVYDAHGHTMVAKVDAIASESGPIVTEHGLTVFPALATGDAGELDRVIVPGVAAYTRAANLIRALPESTTVEFIHAADPTRFGLEPVIEDLARTADGVTARFALRRLEYRSNSIVLGDTLPWQVMVVVAGLAVVGLAIALVVKRSVQFATARLAVAPHYHRHFARKTAAVLLIGFAVACRDALPTAPEDPQPVDPVQPTPVVAGVTLNTYAITVEEGRSEQLIATPRDSSGSALSGFAVTWSSSDPSVAEVNAVGRLTGIRGGAATLTATVNGKSTQANVTVTANYPFELIYSARTFDTFHEAFRRDLGAVDAPPTRLFAENQWAWQPRPSPDGSRIVFVGPNPIIGDPSIFVANRDGSSSEMIVAFIGDVFSDPTWSPDGQQIAYVRSTNDNGTERSHIWVVNADGSNPQPVTTTMAGNQSMPAWSPVLPDGTQRIAFVQNANLQPRIWSVRVDGTDARQLGSTAGASDIQPAWSPDGKTIAFQRTTASIAADIWLMDANGANERALTPLGITGTQMSPHWSPDGRLIAFTSNHETATFQVFTLWTDGSKLARRTFDASEKASPAWLPDER